MRADTDSEPGGGGPTAPAAIRFAERAGRLGIFGGLLWVVAILIEYSQHLQPPSDGALFYANQMMFAVALACWATAVVGLRAVSAAGEGLGRHTLTVWTIGYVLIAAGILIQTVLDLFTSVSPSASADIPLAPIGGVLAVLASITAGVAIVRAQHLTGWSRWVVLGFAIYVFGFLFAPLFVGIEVDAVRETIWGLWWVVIGIVLLSYRPPSEG